MIQDLYNEAFEEGRKAERAEWNKPVPLSEWERLQSDLTQSAEREAALLAKVERLEQGGGCTLAGPGRGDCEHFVGLPGKSIPGQHDGPDDTVDCYGKPNGWCWSCWKSHQLTEAQQLAAHWKANHDNRVAAARVLIERDDLPLERVAAYKHYVELQQLAADRLVQMEQYKKALSKYGHHIEGCGHGWSCTCGFYAAMKETPHDE